MNITTIYLKRHDKEGRVTFTEHTMWDEKLFISTRHAEAVKEGGKAKAEQITREDYRHGVAPRRAA